MSIPTVLIKFPIEIRGEMALNPSVESNPCITLYTDAYIGSTMERRTLTSEWTSIVLVVRAKVLPSIKDYQTYIARGQLNIDGVVDVRTQIGLSARKNAGAARISLATLFAESGHEIELALKMSLLTPEELDSVEPKGKVWIRASSAILINDRPISLLQTREVAQEQWALYQKQRVSRMRELRGLMSAWQFFFEQTHQTFPAADGINCYTLRIADGTILPAIAYMLQPTTAKTDVSYFENALDIVLRREKLSRKDTASMKLDNPQLASVAMQLLCIWCNYIPYVSDEGWVPVKKAENIGDSAWSRLVTARSKNHIEMKHFSMEEFEIAELYTADDCEGVGFVIVRMRSYLLQTDKALRSPALDRICDILTLYVPLLLLCGVTSGDIGGDFASLSAKDAELGAHMFALFIPVQRMMNMIRRCNSVSSPIPNPTLEFELACSQSADLPILCGEGTGLLSPLPIDLPYEKTLFLPPQMKSLSAQPYKMNPPIRVDDASVKIVQDGRGMRPLSRTVGSKNPVFSNNSMWLTDTLQDVFPKVLGNGIRKWYHMCKQPDLTPHFYRTAQLALTPYFVENGTMASSFVFMQRPRGTNQMWKVGCTFSDIFNENNPSSEREVCMWTETPPDAIEYAHMVDEMKCEPRAPPLLPPSNIVGTNNTWDPTCTVYTSQQHAQMQSFLTNVRVSALTAEICSMMHIIKNSSAASFVGTPHLLSSCDCERVLANQLFTTNSEFRKLIGTEGVDAFITKFRSTMTETSMPLTDLDRMHPIVGEWCFNYEQWLQRGEAFSRVVTQSLQLPGCVILPTGLHADFEHVTATVGGIMPRFYVMVEY